MQGKSYWKSFCLFFTLVCITSSCSQQYTQNRAYVISQTQVESEENKDVSLPE